MATIDVYILTDNNHPRQVRYLEGLFSSSLYSVKIVIVDKFTDEDYVKSSLLRTYNDFPERDVIIIKDSSVSVISPEKLDVLCRYIQEENIHLFYFCRWLDACQKIIDIEKIPDTDITIGRTFDPHGVQAIYFSKAGRDALLGKEEFTLNLAKELNDGKLVALCAINNIFNFDITRAVSDLDYLKTHECFVNKSKDSDASNNNGILWFILVVIVVFLVSFAIIRIGKK